MYQNNGFSSIIRGFYLLEHGVYISMKNRLSFLTHWSVHHIFLTFMRARCGWAFSPIPLYVSPIFPVSTLVHQCSKARTDGGINTRAHTYTCIHSIRLLYTIYIKPFTWKSLALTSSSFLCRAQHKSCLGNANLCDCIWHERVCVSIYIYWDRRVWDIEMETHLVMCALNTTSAVWRLSIQWEWETPIISVFV